MALHRDIYWVGRQWAVTGFGVQAIDQRLKGAFDVEATQLWDDELPRRMRSLTWLHAEDFSKALEIARTRFSETPRKSTPLIESVLELIQPTVESSKLGPLIQTGIPITVSEPIVRRQSNLPMLAFRVEGASAKFLPQWRIRN
jgi:hypothetical protein